MSLELVVAVASVAFAAGGAWTGAVLGVRYCLREHGRRIGSCERRLDAHDARFARFGN